MVSIPKVDSPRTVHSNQSVAAGSSDTESNSGRDNEVSALLLSPCVVHEFNAKCFLGVTRMFSTLKQRWKEGVCQVPLRLRYGLLPQNG